MSGRPVTLRDLCLYSWISFTKSHFSLFCLSTPPFDLSSLYLHSGLSFTSFFVEFYHSTFTPVSRLRPFVDPLSVIYHSTCTPVSQKMRKPQMNVRPAGHAPLRPSERLKIALYEKDVCDPVRGSKSPSLRRGRLRPSERLKIGLFRILFLVNRSASRDPEKLMDFFERAPIFIGGFVKKYATKSVIFPSIP